MTMQQGSIIPVEEYRQNFKKNKRTSKEQKVQFQFCDYIKLKYPDLIFTCDLASGMNLGKFIGGMNTRLRSSRAQPDVFIAQPSMGLRGARSSDMQGQYHGLFIELKKEGTTIWLKNGEMTADKHIREQAAMLERLRKLGYKAEFAIGLEDAIKLLTEYLSGEPLG